MYDACTDVSLVFMITIVNRGSSEKIMNIFNKEGVMFCLLTLGKGTANSKILDYLGLGETEKELLFSTMPLRQSKLLLDKMNTENYLNKSGRGIAFTVPVNGIYGINTKKYHEKLMKINGGDYMEQVNEHDLIIAIANRGFSDMVMEAAKSAKVTRGTVIHARGSGFEGTEKFFGITIQPEKELILIVATKDISRDVMKEITARAGVHTEARTIAFSLPVNGVAGFTTVFKE